MDIIKKINAKIVSSIKLKSILRKLANKTSIMCHGNFDLVHPGHVRHLLYAKSKADILIVSITADKNIKKKKNLPVIPDKLRAHNLASLEMVDFVLIDKNETPIKNIKYLKPNFFIKGYEYNNKKNYNTLSELKTTKSYGGKMIFSPGDVVYSSTILKEANNLTLPLERLDEIMRSHNISFSKIVETVEMFKKVNAHVIGDTIIDGYHECQLLGQTNKTPTFSLKKLNSNNFVGGAGVVAKHLNSLGAKVVFTTLVGNDNRAKIAKNDLKKYKIKTNFIVDDLRPTTFKERFWVDNYKLLQVDELENSIIDDEKINLISKFIKEEKSDLMVFSDFRHGIFNKDTINIFAKSISNKCIKVADSQVSNRWGNILDFKKFDILFPNEKEARFSLADQESSLRPLGQAVLKQSRAKNLILKLSEKGAMFFKKKGYNRGEFASLDSFAKNVIDGVGSGDALLSSASLTYAITRNLAMSIIIGSFSAAIACANKGNNPIHKRDLINFIKEIESKF